MKLLNNQTSLKEQKGKSKVQKRLRAILQNEKKKNIRAKNSFESRVTRLKLIVSIIARLHSGCIITIFRYNNNDNEIITIVIIICKCRYLCQVSDRDTRRSSLTAIIEFRL